MISFIILISIVAGLFALANKVVENHDYEYGGKIIEDFERYNKDSFYFK